MHLSLYGSLYTFPLLLQSYWQLLVVTMTIIAKLQQHFMHCFASLQYEPDCPGYHTERYTVDTDGVQVADMTADEFQSRITDFSNGFATLSLPLTQRLPEKAMTVNMTKFNTVPTNMSDDMGNIVTEMMTWGTSAVFGEVEVAIKEQVSEKKGLC